MFKVTPNPAPLPAPTAMATTYTHTRTYTHAHPPCPTHTHTHTHMSNTHTHTHTLMYAYIRNLYVCLLFLSVCLSVCLCLSLSLCLSLPVCLSVSLCIYICLSVSPPPSTKAVCTVRTAGLLSGAAGRAEPPAEGYSLASLLCPPTPPRYRVLSVYKPQYQAPVKHPAPVTHLQWPLKAKSPKGPKGKL